MSKIVSQQSTKKAFPGMCLGSCIDFKPSDGTYVYMGKIYSSRKGIIKYNGDSNEVVSVVDPSSLSNVQDH